MVFKKIGPLGKHVWTRALHAMYGQSRYRLMRFNRLRAGRLRGGAAETVGRPQMILMVTAPMSVDSL